MQVESLKEILSSEIDGGAAVREASGCFLCDIMSRTMAKGFSGMAWITHRADMNALAVAVMKGAACMIFPEGIRPEKDVIERAQKEKVPLLQAKESAYVLAGRLYAAGLSGGEE